MRLLLILAPLLLLAGAADASGGGAVFRHTTVEGTAIHRTYETRCSFDVRRFAPGRYVTSANAAENIATFWTDENARSANLWLYAHPENECRAAGGAVGYRYTWRNSTAIQLAKAIDTTGLARTRFLSDGAIELTVLAPLMLSGEIAERLGFSRAAR